LNLSKVHKKNFRNEGEDYLSIGYVDATKYLTKSQRKEDSKNNFICKYCKRRLTNAYDLKDHMRNKHLQKISKENIKIK
jgi:uncharacterized Zn-finger protein